MNKSQMVLAHLHEYPNDSNKHIAMRFGCTDALVSIVRKEVSKTWPCRHSQAVRRRMSLMQLDEAILKAVYSGNLVDAVLDDQA